MSRICKAPKVNEAALRNAVLRFNNRYETGEVKGNFFEIFTGKYEIDVDDVIGLSFRLYGNHNQLKIVGPNACLVLQGATYRLLPEFLIEGEEIEFELPDR